jgi:hypothetical protein
MNAFNVKTLWLVACFVALFFVNTSMAVQCIRCGGNLVCEGDSESELMEVCGKPDYVEDKGILKIPVGYRSYAYKPVRVFYYNCGSDRLVQFVTITGGTITEIRSGKKYGSGIPRCNE